MSHSSISLISSKTSNPLFPFHILLLCEFYSIALPHGYICVSTSSSSRLLVNLFLLSGRVRSPKQNHSFSVFIKSRGPCRFVFIPIPSLFSPDISKCLSDCTWLHIKRLHDGGNAQRGRQTTEGRLASPSFLSFLLLLLPFTSQSSLRTKCLLGFLLYPSTVS